MNNSRIVAGLYALGLVGTGIHSHDKKQKNCQVLPREWTKNPGMCYGFFSFFMVGMVNMLGNGTIHLVKVCCGLHSCYLIWMHPERMIPFTHYFAPNYSEKKQSKKNTSNIQQNNIQNRSWICFYSPSFGEQISIERRASRWGTRSALEGKFTLSTPAMVFLGSAPKAFWLKCFVGVGGLVFFKNIWHKFQKLEKLLFEGLHGSIKWFINCMKVGASRNLEFVQFGWYASDFLPSPCQCMIKTQNQTINIHVGYLHVLHDSVVVPLRLSKSKKTWFIQAERRSSKPQNTTKCHESQRSA